MAVPKHLRFFTLFVDGENEVGNVTSVTLPKLTRNTDSYRGGEVAKLEEELGYHDGFLDTAEHFYLFVIQGPKSLATELAWTNIRSMC